MRMDFEPLYTGDQLKALASSGTQRMEAAFDRAPADAIEQYSRSEEALRWFCGLYLQWIQLTVDYLGMTHGREARLAALPPERLAEFALRSGMEGDTLRLASELLAGPDNSQAAAFAAAVDSEDRDSALDVWRRTEHTLKLTHDFRREAITELLSVIYRDHGLSSLEAAQAYAAERGPWVEAMPAEVALDPKQRLEELAFLLAVSCFFDFEIEEQHDRWILWVGTCGNCGRQLRDRYGKDDWGFAIIREPGPATFQLDALTVYQSHFALIHHVYAIGAVGAPCPAISCAGLEAGSKPCAWHLFKNPADTDARFFEVVGLDKPAAAAGDAPVR